jgi:hypothetical protein
MMYIIQDESEAAKVALEKLALVKDLSIATPEMVEGCVFVDGSRLLPDASGIL